MGRYITGFTTEHDVRLTLEAMEKKGWRWINGDQPTKWNGWEINGGNYSSLSLSYEDSFGWSVLPKEGTINFREAILELGNSTPSSAYATYADVLKSDGKEFSATVDGEYVSGVIDIGLDNTVTFYFNSSSTGWGSNAKEGYSKGWNICPSNFPKDVTIKSITAATPTNLLSFPEYFYIERDHKDPRWKEFIIWINSTYGTEFIGDNYKYYGWDGHKGQRSCWDDVSNFDHNPKKLTLDEWEAIKNNTTPSVEADATADVDIPEYFTIPCNSNNKQHPLWKKYIAWLNEKYDAMNLGDSDNGFYGHHRNGDTYNHPYEMKGEQEITLEFWNIHMAIPTAPVTASSLEEAVAKLRTVDHTDPSTGIKTPGLADLRLTAAPDRSTGNWHSTRVDGEDPLRMTAYQTLVHATPTRVNDSICARYRQMGKTYNTMMNDFVDKQAIQGPTPSQVFIDGAVDEAPTKTSRYSSMLDLI